MILKNVRHRLRLAWTNVKVARSWDVLIEKAVTIKYAETISFGDHGTLQSGAYLYGSRTGRSVAIGSRVVLAAGSVVLGEGGVAIGDYTHLGPGAIVTTQYGDSTREMATEQPNVKTAPVTIGKGCWIGSGAVVMPGATIGDRCVVAPGAVVYGSFPEGSTIAGNPARRQVNPFRRDEAQPPS